MKRIAVLAAAAVVALGIVTAANAGTASGSTTILGAEAPNALAFTPTDVRVEIVTKGPVVPYVYSLVNKCWFDGKTSGPSDSYERFDLAGPWFDDDGNPDTSAMTVAVNLNPVSPGAKCKVSIYKNNTAVKDTTTTYEIVGP